MICIKTTGEIELLHQTAQVVSRILGLMAKEVKPGVTTLYLDRIAEEYIHSRGAVPGFLGLYGFPNALCMSPNTRVVRDIPNNHPLQEGDIVSIDCRALKDSYYSDHAYTFGVDEVAPEVKEPLHVTKGSLYVDIRQFHAGNRVDDVGHAIQQRCKAHGYGVVHKLMGHDVGRRIHKDPGMLNYGGRGNGKKFKDGMIVAIKPMTNTGIRNIRQLRDGWTILTADGKPSAHFEHDAALIDGKPRLLSTFKYIYEALDIENNEEDEFLLS